MNKAEAYAQTFEVSRHRVRHRYKTALAYAERVAEFVAFCQEHRPSGANEEKVAAYLSHRAPHIAASTQNQILNALLFFFEHVVGRKLGALPGWGRAQRPKRLPVWLNQAETRRLLDLMPGTFGLMARVTYGSGLRLMECVRLRMQHVDLERRTLFILGAKGDKDRVVPLARACVPDLAAHIQRCRSLWEADRANAVPGVALPDGFERKAPRAGEAWEWFWLWPGRSLSTDPESGIVRRHHAHEKVYSRALKTAARRAGIAKRVTMHVLRHSFATHALEQGMPLPILQRIMGHTFLETTSVYLHCLPRIVHEAPSPLDALAQQFEQPMTYVRIVGGRPVPFQLGRDDIRGQHDLRILFNPGNLDAEKLKAKAEIAQTIILPMDRAGTIDWAPVAAGMFGEFFPEFADQAVRSPEQSDAAEVKDEANNWALIMSGTEPDMAENGQNFALRLQWLRQKLQEPGAAARLAHLLPRLWFLLRLPRVSLLQLLHLLPRLRFVPQLQRLPRLPWQRAGRIDHVSG